MDDAQTGDAPRDGSAGQQAYAEAQIEALKSADAQITNLADIYMALRMADAEAEHAVRMAAPPEFITAAGKARSFEEIGISAAEVFAAARDYARRRLKARAEDVRRMLTVQYGLNVAQMATLERFVETAVKVRFSPSAVSGDSISRVEEIVAPDAWAAPPAGDEGASS